MRKKRNLINSLLRKKRFSKRKKKLIKNHKPWKAKCKRLRMREKPDNN